MTEFTFYYQGRVRFLRTGGQLESLLKNIKN